MSWAILETYFRVRPISNWFCRNMAFVRSTSWAISLGKLPVDRLLACLFILLKGVVQPGESNPQRQDHEGKHAQNADGDRQDGEDHEVLQARGVFP